MKSVKLFPLRLCALSLLLLGTLSLSDAQPLRFKKELVLQWTSVERRSPSDEIYRINSLSCRQAYCRLEILYIFGCNAGNSAISTQTMRTASPEGGGLEITRTGNTVYVVAGKGQNGTRERLTYKITGEGPDVESGRVIQYDGESLPGGGRYKLEPVKGRAVSIPCPVIVPGVGQD